MLRLSTRAAAIAAMVVASSLGTVVLTSGAASATTSTKPTVTCTKFSATASGKATLGSCTTASTGGSGAEVANLTKKTATITWKNKDTTLTKFTYGSVTANKCPAKSSEIKEVATVTGGTADKSIKVGQVGTLLLCIKGSTVSLLAGQKYQI
jgi:hypothetical protein